jgi:hypothetical protein
MLHEQMSKLNKDSVELWDKIYSEMMSPWMNQWQTLMQDSMTQMLQAMRMSYETGVSTANRMLEQNMSCFLKSYQHGSDYQKQAWESMKEAQETQEEKTKEFLSNVKNIISEEEGKRGHRDQPQYQA